MLHALEFSPPMEVFPDSGAVSSICADQVIIMFLNREQAGTILAKRLIEFISTKPILDRKLDTVVAALPRGGVPVALEVARKFGCRVELIVAEETSVSWQPAGCRSSFIGRNCNPESLICQTTMNGRNT